MIHCLIVDDEPSKVAQIKSVIHQECGESSAIVVVASNAYRAAELMRGRAYDLLVMDLNLPIRDGVSPSEDGSNKLLRQIGRGTAGLERPSFVVGVTAFDSLAEKNLSEFHAHGWAIVKYEAASTAWEQTVATQCRHVLEVKARYSRGHSGTFDACICTALAEPELRAYTDYFGATHHATPGDSIRYASMEIEESGKSCRIILAAAPEMGVTGMSFLTTKMLLQFQPKVALLTGICAGIRAEIGDIVIAESSLNYESGKWSQADESIEATFSAEPRYIQASTGAIGALKHFQSEQAGDILGLPANFRIVDAPKQPQICIGPVACGASVIESTDMIEGLMYQNRKLEGLEMESYGFYLACRNAHRSLEFAMIKGVCDRGRPPKEDRYQGYSAYLSAAFAVSFLRHELRMENGLLARVIA